MTRDDVNKCLSCVVHRKVDLNPNEGVGRMLYVVFEKETRKATLMTYSYNGGVVDGMSKDTDCDNVLFLREEGKTVCDSKMEKVHKFGQHSKDVLRQSYCCDAGYTTCSDNTYSTKVDKTVCPNTCCWERTCRHATDDPDSGVCDNGDICCDHKVAFCRNGVLPYEHNDCPTSCCSSGCDAAFF